jgi:hypothetical protein
MMKSQEKIPSIFSEENMFLDADNMLILNRHYMKCYSQLRKEILEHMEDMMTQDSLSGSKVSTRSRKSGSVVSRMPSPSVKSVDTNTSRHQKPENQKNPPRHQDITHHQVST